MRYLKPIMAIAAICASMLTMRVVMRSRNKGGMRKRRRTVRRGR